MVYEDIGAADYRDYPRATHKVTRTQYEALTVDRWLSDSPGTWVSDQSIWWSAFCPVKSWVTEQANRYWQLDNGLYSPEHRPSNLIRPLTVEDKTKILLDAIFDGTDGRFQDE